MTTSTPTVLVAAAPTLYREGLVALFREQWPHLRLSLTADAMQAASLACSQSYELFILDGLLPGVHVSPLLTRLHHARPTQRHLLLTSPNAPIPPCPLPLPDTRLLVSRQAPLGQLIAALAPWFEKLRTANLDAPRRCLCQMADSFSARELQVLSLVVADHCNREIADQLCLSVRTVESHRRMLLQKSGTRTLVGLAARAVREGWVA